MYSNKRTRVSISEVAEVNPRLPKSLAQDSGRPVTFLPMAGVSEEGSIQSSDVRKLGEVAKGYRYFEKGDVLLAKITPCMENGKAAVADSMDHRIGFGSTEFHVIRPGPEVDARYLFYAIWNPRFRAIAKRNMTGTAGQKRVPTDFVERFKIPLPPLGEQRRIAGILDKADAIRRKRQESIRLTEEFLRSLFLDMFGDPVTNPKGWRVVPLSHFGKIVTGNTPSRSHAEFYGSRTEWIKSDNINTPFHYLTEAAERLSELGESVARLAPAGAILVTCIAGSKDCIGNAAIADRDVAFNQQINAIIPYEMSTQLFLYSQVLMAKRLIQAASTQCMKGLVSKSAFSRIRFMNPTPDEQRRFSERMATIQCHIDLVRKSRGVCEESLGALTGSVFQGKAKRRAHAER